MADTIDSFGSKALRFYQTISPPHDLLKGVDVINPYQDVSVQQYLAQYFSRYFNDSNPRVFVLGINPGRFGSGVTGIPFADPVTLETLYRIENDLPKKRELSAQFVQMVIEHWGGPAAFYCDFYVTAMSPFGFTKNGTNYNYYDESKMLETMEPYIVTWVERQLSFGARKTAIVFGKGRNSTVVRELNSRYKWFERILELEHPRYVMQYKRKELSRHIRSYTETFRNALAAQSSETT